MTSEGLPALVNDTHIWNSSNNSEPTANVTRVKPPIVSLRLPTWIYFTISMYITINMTVLFVKTRFPRTPHHLRHGCIDSSRLKVARLFAAYFTTLGFLYHSFSCRIEEIPVINCNWLKKMEIYLYWMNLSAIYAVLWMRQRIIYRNPVLRHLTTTATRFISNLAIVLVILSPAINGTLTAVAISFKHYDNEVCALGRYTASEKLITAGDFTFPIALPLILMALFVLPLIKHYQVVREYDINEKPIFIVKKIVLLTMGCLVTDIGAMVCNKECRVFESFIGRQTSLFANFFLLNFAFSDWKHVVVPCLPSNAPKNENGGGTDLD